MKYYVCTVYVTLALDDYVEKSVQLLFAYYSLYYNKADVLYKKEVRTLANSTQPKSEWCNNSFLFVLYVSHFL